MQFQLQHRHLPSLPFIKYCSPLPLFSAVDMASGGLLDVTGAKEALQELDTLILDNATRLPLYFIQNLQSAYAMFRLIREKSAWLLQVSRIIYDLSELLQDFRDKADREFARIDRRLGKLPVLPAALRYEARAPSSLVSLIRDLRAWHEAFPYVLTSHCSEGAC